MGPLSDDRLALLRAVLAGKGRSLPQPIPRRVDPSRAPLSLAQERLYFLELYDPGTALYNDGIAVAIEGPLESQRLARAVAAVQERHEILRTTFHLAGEGAEQRIHAAGTGGARLFRTMDLGGTDGAGDAGRTLAEEEAARPFDLEREPPWRVVLARLGAERWLLVVTIHHIVSDGASMGLLFDDLSAAYAGTPRAPLALQFGDYASWERASEAPERAAEHVEHWKRALAGATRALAWKDGAGKPSGRGVQVALDFAPGTRERVEALARAEGATPNHVYLAVWLALLASASGANDPVTGVASSLRGRREIEALVGFFVQSLPFAGGIAGDPSFRSALERVRAAALAAHAHAGVPFDRLVRALDGGSGGPFLRAFFAHMRDAIRAPSFAGTRTSWEFVDPGSARFDLTLVLHESRTELTGFLEADRGVFARASAERLGERYARLLAAALEDPGARLSEFERRSAPSRASRVLAFPSDPRRAAGSGT
jgi:hypothetical protein